MAQRKTDRRTIITKTIIKDTLLELLKNEVYDKITVSALCKRAEITRATFYLHYQNLDEVLDETLDDALRLTELDPQFSEYESSHEAYFAARDETDDICKVMLCLWHSDVSSLRSEMMLLHFIPQ